MSRAIHDINGYTVVLDKVAFVTRVFSARNDEGYQFNIRFGGDTHLAMKFPDLSEATLARELLLKALRGS